MFAQLIFYFLVMLNSLHHFIGWSFNYFTVIPILEVYIICLSNIIFKNTFVTTVWGKNGGTA